MKPVFYRLDFITTEVTKVELLCHHNNFQMECWDYRKAASGYEMVYRSYDECVVREIQCMILWDRQQHFSGVRGTSERKWELAMRAKKEKENETTNQ